MVTFRQPCLKVANEFINDMVFVWYAGLILLNQVQSMVSLSYFVTSQKVFPKSFRKV